MDEDLELPDGNAMATAALWHARLEGNSPDTELTRQCREWLAAAPEHRSAFDALSKLSGLLDEAKDAAEIQALRDATARRMPERASRFGWTAWTAIAACLIAILAVPLALVLKHTDLAPPAADLELARETAIGAQRRVPLPDGSVVLLNTDSRIEVAYSAVQRQITLARGEALFDVAKGKPAPFVVVAAGSQVVAHGTRFDVRVIGQSLSVGLLQGKVTVAARGQPDAAGIPMKPGQLLVANGANTSITDHAALDHMVSWQSGFLVFNKDSLGTAVSEINRYSGEHIRLDDPQLGNRPISGSFAIGGTQGFVDALRLTFPDIRVTRRDGLIVVTRYSGV